MIRVTTIRAGLRHDVVWFASGEFDATRFPADVTYLRQHSMTLPTETVVRSTPVDTLVLDLRNDEDAIWSAVRKSVRYDIRRAGQEGLVIAGATDPADVAVTTFLERHRAFVARRQLGASLTRRQLEAYEGHWTLLSASSDGSWLSDLLLLHDETRSRRWVAFSASDQAADRAQVGRASKALDWHSVLLARTAGRRVYDVGGMTVGRPELEGINSYKRGFGGTPLLEHDALVVPRRSRRLAYRTLERVRSIAAPAAS
jgi:hypothetical protein